jgi:hypothetical protein
LKITIEAETQELADIIKSISQPTVIDTKRLSRQIQEGFQELLSSSDGYEAEIKKEVEPLSENKSAPNNENFDAEELAFILAGRRILNELTK